MNKKINIQWLISHVFLISKIHGYQQSEQGYDRYIPWQQQALLYAVNDAATFYNHTEVTFEQLSRALCSMKKKGRMKRISWRNPSKNNIWLYQELPKVTK